MNTVIELPLQDATDTEALGIKLAPLLTDVRLVTFAGELGSGKTTLVRGILRGLGYEGTVKSPTFTLIEPYSLGEREVYHFDLYRMQKAEELEFIDAREILQSGGLCLIEWPERGRGFLLPAELNVTIHKVKQGRMVRLEINTEYSAVLSDRLRHALEPLSGVQAR